MVMDHTAMMQAGVGLPTLAEDTIPQEGGQAAFSAIAEIVARLVADPATDWTKVDVEALRQHLIDMDNVTLHAEVTTTEIEGGARFDASADDPVVQASIRRMALAHVATMSGYLGLNLSAEPTERGAALTATGSTAQVPMLRGLGFIGVLSLGAHHQAHHLALATGQNPH